MHIHAIINIFIIIPHKEEKTMVNITSLQNHVLGPSEDVPYAALTERAYPPTAFRERFMSVKILMQDEGYMNARCGAERMKQLDSACRPILANSGCILREAEADTVPNGIYLISLPVPRSQFQRQLGIVLSVMNRLAQDLGIMYTGVIETNVSGRMNEYDEQIAKKMFRLPQSLEEKITKRTDGFSQSVGKLEKINSEYEIFRVLWRTVSDNIIDEILEMMNWQLTLFFVG
jgi:hypothetical protein